MSACRRAPNINNDIPTLSEQEIQNEGTNADQLLNGDNQLLFGAPLQTQTEWKLAFVSQDGPRAHENVSACECYSLAWCQAWQGAQASGQDSSVNIKLTYPEDCSGDEDCWYKQIEAINQLIEAGDVDGMVIGPRDSRFLVPVIDKAIDSGIEVVALDTPLNTDNVISLVTFDNLQGGKAIGNWVSEQLNRQGNAVLIEGPTYQNNAKQRRDGTLLGLKNSNINVLDTRSTIWSPKEAGQFTTDWLKQHKELDAIIVASDNMAIQVNQVVAEADRHPILITGFDGTQQGLEAIANNQLAATVAQNHRQQGYVATQVLLHHLENQTTFPKRIFTPTPEIITKQNLNTAENYQPSDCS